MTDQEIKLTPASVPVRNEDAIVCEVENELVVYAPDANVGISLNSSAKTIWGLCENGRTLGQIADEIAATLGVAEPAAKTELAQDVASAVEDLLRKGLAKLA